MAKQKNRKDPGQGGAERPSTPAAPPSAGEGAVRRPSRKFRALRAIKRWYAGTTASLALLGAIASLILQYQDSFGPFELVGSVGSLGVFGEHPGRESNGAFLFVQLTVRNDGATTGRLTDVAAVTTGGGKTAWCRPAGLFDDAKWLAATVKKEPGYAAFTGNWSAPLLGPKEQRELKLLLVCDSDPQPFPLLAAGGATMKIMVRIDQRAEYETIEERPFPNPQPNLIAEIQRGQAFLFLDASSNDLRRNLR